MGHIDQRQKQLFVCSACYTTQFLPVTALRIYVSIVATIFPGEPGLAGFVEAKVEVMVTAGAIIRAKLQSNCHHQQTITLVMESHGI